MSLSEDIERLRSLTEVTPNDLDEIFAIIDTIVHMRACQHKSSRNMAKRLRKHDAYIKHLRQSITVFEDGYVDLLEEERKKQDI